MRPLRPAAPICPVDTGPRLPPRCGRFGRCLTTWNYQMVATKEPSFLFLMLHCPRWQQSQRRSKSPCFWMFLMFMSLFLVVLFACFCLRFDLKHSNNDSPLSASWTAGLCPVQLGGCTFAPWNLSDSSLKRWVTHGYSYSSLQFSPHHIKNHLVQQPAGCFSLQVAMTCARSPSWFMAPIL